MPYIDTRNHMFTAQIITTFGITPLPCPFCAFPHVHMYLGPNPHMTCPQCQADGPLPERRFERADNMSKMAQALLLWNQRGPV